MSNANHLSNDDLSLFALQLLPEPEMKAIALHLKECPLCSSEVANIQGDLMAYAMTAEMEVPPTRARERLLQQISKEKKLVPKTSNEVAIEPVLYPRNSRMFQMDSPEQKPKRKIGFIGWAGWAVAAGVAVAGGLQFQQVEQLQRNLAVQTAKLSQVTSQSAKADEAMQTLTDATAMQVSLHVPLTSGTLPKQDPEGHVVYVPGNGSLVFVASHLDPLQPYKTYELWLLPSDPSQKPVPAGLFKPDANGYATVVMPELPKGVSAKGFGVTVEDDGGSKTPTAPIILAGL